MHTRKISLCSNQGLFIDHAFLIFFITFLLLVIIQIKIAATSISSKPIFVKNKVNFREKESAYITFLKLIWLISFKLIWLCKREIWYYNFWFRKSLKLGERWKGACLEHLFFWHSILRKEHFLEKYSIKSCFDSCWIKCSIIWKKNIATNLQRFHIFINNSRV